MKSKIKKLLQKFYRLINAIPFNNSIKTQKTKIVNEGTTLLKCKIVSRGNNTIIFSRGGVIRNTTICIHGNNNIIEIGERVHIYQGSIHIEDDNNRVEIGAETNLCGKTHLACTEGKKISIGKDCLFSSEIVFRTGDSHSIVNMAGERINPAEDIVVHDHVWIGHRVCVNKGVVIPSHTIIGTGSIVTKAFEESNTILAGVPAKVVKSNVDWRTERI